MQGYATTFCNLRKHKIFDIVKGRSENGLKSYMQALERRERVNVFCIDLSSTYRHLIKRYFPSAMIVADRFHVICLIFISVCKPIKRLPPKMKNQRCLLVALCTHPENLNSHYLKNRHDYLEQHPAINAIYQLKRQLHQMLIKKTLLARECKKVIPVILEMITALKQSPFKRLMTLSKTLY